MTLLQGRKQSAVASACLQFLPTTPLPPKLDIPPPPPPGFLLFFYPQTKTSAIEIELSNFSHTSASAALHPGAGPCCAH